VQGLRLLLGKDALDLRDGHDLLPQGSFSISDGESEPEETGDYLVNLKDLQNTKRHRAHRRLIGCCGPDGLGGLNLLCEKGHEIGTERSDCWLSHHAVLSCRRVREA
jgi:hypothetical protein